MKGSLIIIGFFILGTICGIYSFIPYNIAESKFETMTVSKQNIVKFDIFVKNRMRESL